MANLQLTVQYIIQLATEEEVINRGYTLYNVLVTKTEKRGAL